MKDEKLLSLVDFEWASVARYIYYISSVAGLKEINSNYVVSFPLARLGPDKLLKQKERVLLALEHNKKMIERFVGEHRDSLDKSEVAVLRTLYMQYKSNAEVVQGHIAAVGACMIEVELFIISQEEEN